MFITLRSVSDMGDNSGDLYNARWQPYRTVLNDLEEIHEARFQTSLAHLTAIGFD